MLSKYDKLRELNLEGASASTNTILRCSRSHGIQLLFICVEDLDFRDADVEGVLSTVRSVYSDSPLIGAAVCFFFRRSHSGFQRLQKDSEKLFVLLCSVNCYLGLL